MLLVSLALGAGLGAIVMSFLVSAAYERGYTDASRRHREWRTELTQRRAVDHKVRTAA